MKKEALWLNAFLMKLFFVVEEVIIYYIHTSDL